MKNIRGKISILLDGGDLRSISDSNEVISLISDQDDFDILFSYLYDNNRLIVMRAADSIEKVSRKQFSYLDKHKASLLDLMTEAKDKELKWHLAQLASRLKLNDNEQNRVFGMLKKWALDKDESKIVRANSLQALHEISCDNEVLAASFDEILGIVKAENIPSLNARIKKLMNLH